MREGEGEIVRERRDVEVVEEGVDEGGEEEEEGGCGEEEEEAEVEVAGVRGEEGAERAKEEGLVGVSYIYRGGGQRRAGTCGLLMMFCAGFARVVGSSELS